MISNILKVISLLMAATTIFTITYIDLVNNRRQIGVERAIGIRSVPIVVTYLIKALVYAGAGVLCGLLLFGLVITPYVAAHPFHFPNGSVGLDTTRSETVRDVVILLLVSALAAIAPAVRSVRVRILDAIWGA